MLRDCFPVLGLRLTTPRLELRRPDDAQLDALAGLVAGGVHAPDEMPFTTSWTEWPPELRARRTVQAHWTALGALGAEDATSVAFVDNTASIAVSRRLGYQPDGVQRDNRRDGSAMSQRMRLSASAWRAHASIPVRMEGVEACREILGAEPPAA